ncbi:MAG: hypothetical protein ACKN9J_04865 [Holophagaceae bacterium]|jgi:hypothetical protein
MTSKRIKIVWASLGGLLSLLVGIGISVSKDGTALSILSNTVPLGPEGVNALVFTFMMGFIKWANPLLCFLVGIPLMSDNIQAHKVAQRYVGFFKGLWDGLKEGLFYTQWLLLPLFVFALRFFPSNDVYELLITNGVTCLIGIQYLLWYILLVRLVRHPGLSFFLVLLLAELSLRGGFLVDFGEQMGLKTDTVHYLSLGLPALPILFVSLDAFNTTTSLIALGIPLGLALLALLIPE